MRVEWSTRPRGRLKQSSATSADDNDEGQKCNHITDSARQRVGVDDCETETSRDNGNALEETERRNVSDETASSVLASRSTVHSTCTKRSVTKCLCCFVSPPGGLPVNVLSTRRLIICSSVSVCNKFFWSVYLINQFMDFFLSLRFPTYYHGND